MLPLSALATFILMRLFGLSANLMSLGGLAIAIGMLVDAAVVVVENVDSQLERSTGTTCRTLHLIYPRRPRGRRAGDFRHRHHRDRVPAAADLQGLEGKLFAPVALTIVFALSASLLLSLTVMPVLASFLLKRGVHHQPWLVRKLDALYDRVLDRGPRPQPPLHRRRAARPARRRRRLPAARQDLHADDGRGRHHHAAGKTAVDQPGASHRHSTCRVQQAILERVPEIKGIVARVGSDELGLDPMGLNQTDTFLVLKPRTNGASPTRTG